MEHAYDDRYEQLEEEDYRSYRQPLSYHHNYRRDANEPQQFYRNTPPEPETNWLARGLSWFDAKGAYFTIAVAIAVIVYTHYQGMCAVVVIHVNVVM